MFRARSSLNIGAPQSPRPGNRRTMPQGLQRRLMGGTGRAPKRNPSRRAIRIERSTNDDQDIQRQDHRDARHLMMSCSYLAVLFVDCEPPDHTRSDNGTELTALAVRTCSPGLACKRFSSIAAGPGRMATTRASLPRPMTSC